MAKKTHYECIQDIASALPNSEKAAQSLVNNLMNLVLTDLVEIGLLKNCDACSGNGHIENEHWKGDKRYYIECKICEGRGVIR